MSRTEIDTLIEKLDRDLREAARTLSDHEARFLVDTYYAMQRERIRADAQVRAMTDQGEPALVFKWIAEQKSKLEIRIQQALKVYAENDPVGEWMLDIDGIGPVIASGLRANIDIDEAPTVGHIWSFAGLNPKATWLGKTKARSVTAFIDDPKRPMRSDDIIRIADRLNGDAKWIARRAYRAMKERKKEETYIPYRSKTETMEPKLYIEMIWDGEHPRIDDVIMGLSKRPWSATLKVLCWKLGQSFVKVQNKDTSFYGPLLKERKAAEIARNMCGELSEQAESILASRNIGKETTAYKFYSGQLPAEVWPGWPKLDAAQQTKRINEMLLPEGQGLRMLPPGHIQQRAERWTVKLFLAHLHEFWYQHEFGVAPPEPYAKTMLGHAHIIKPPSHAS